MGDVNFWKRHFSKKALSNKNKLVSSLEGAGDPRISYISPVQAEVQKVQAEAVKTKKRKIRRKSIKRKVTKKKRQSRKTKPKRTRKKNKGRKK